MTTTVYAKASTTARVPASLIKMLTAVTMRQWIDDAHLDDTVTVTSADLVGGATASLTNGDQVTYRKLLYGMMLPSGNDAAHAIARNVGAAIIAAGGGGSDPYTRFLAEMATRATALGLTSVVADDSYGLSANNRLSPADAATLAWAINDDATLKTIAGTYTYSMVITGANARTYTITNLFNPTASSAKFPEHVASKYGWTTEAKYCLALLWRTRAGQDRVTVVMGANTETEMLTDLRRLLNLETARAL